ncbi:hypothetical protein BTUL_0139g00350 [Botrytis tulipae]|uniref:Uncharacterized protein n=1 Tax=Botrytis tulipae TaxID=87230 RepID=A0A4Z1EHP1_9HELO|nr:hypothetical protein BTUL_0139g00350 [Botrytis tulipae]
MQQNVTSFNNQKGDAVDVTCYGSKESNGGFEESYTSRELGERNTVHRAVGNLDFEVKSGSLQGISAQDDKITFPFSLMPWKVAFRPSTRVQNKGTPGQYTQDSMQSAKAKNTFGGSSKLSDQGQKRPARCWAP